MQRWQMNFILSPSAKLFPFRVKFVFRERKFVMPRQLNSGANSAETTQISSFGSYLSLVCRLQEAYF